MELTPESAGSTLCRSRHHLNALRECQVNYSHSCPYSNDSGYCRQPEIPDRCNLLPETLVTVTESQTSPVTIYSVGRFDLLHDGEPVKSSRKTQRKPLELLKALVSLGPEPVGEETLSELLCPESDGDAVYTSLKVTLHRLRKLIGNGSVIRFQEGRIFIDRRYVWVDAWAFEQAYAIAKEEWNKGNDDEAVRFLEKALLLYRGEFLAGEREREWMFTMRDRLRDKYIHIIRMLAQRSEIRCEFQKAMDIYNRGLEIDPLAEEFYQGLMACCNNLGARSEALNVYRRCEKILTIRSKTAPSDQTKQIFMRILQRKSQ